MELDGRAGRDAKRHTTVYGEAKAAITRIANEHGMKEIAVVSRVYLWLARQTDDVLVKGVLGLLPRDYEDQIVELALQRVRSKKGGK